MSVSNPRQKSAFAPIKPDISVPLDVQREHSRLRLKSAWDSIIERYSQEFDDDDEIDLLTEEIIVDRGFLRNQPIRKIGTLTKYMEEYEDEESSGTDSESDSESESDEESADDENQENIDQVPDEIAPASKHSGRKKSKKSSNSKADKEDDDQENDDVYDDIFLNLVNSTKGKFSKLKYTPKSRVSMDCNRSVKSATSVLETAKHTIDELIYDCDEELKVEVEKTLLTAATEELNISENENNTTLDNTEVAVIKKGFSSRKTTVKETVTSTVDRTRGNNLKSKSSKLRSYDSSQSDSDYAEGRKGRTIKSKLPNSPPTTIHDDSETESDPSLQQYYQSKPRRRGRPPKSRPISDAMQPKSAKSPQESTDDKPRRRGRPPKCRPILDATRLKSAKSPEESTDDTESEVGGDYKTSHPVTVKRKRHNINHSTSKGSKTKAFENSENTEPKSKKSKISVVKLTGQDTSVAGRQRKSPKRLELKPSGQSETTDSDSDFASFSASVSKTKLKVKNHPTRSPMHRVEKSKPMNAKSIRKTLEELGVTTSTTFPGDKKCPSPRSLLSSHRTRHSKSSSSPHKKRLSIVSEQACSVSSAQISQDCDYDEYQPHSAEFEHDEHGSPKELSTSTLVSSSDTTSIVAGLSCAEISCNDDAASAEESVVSQQIECDYDGGLISGPGEEDEEDQCRSGPEDEDELSESERLAQENRKSNQYGMYTTYFYLLFLC
ncbi:hypothetical protein BKA69DRAFT_237221 [Paraphysoderma sedebokerense]|nr:hypothetical protein BKA69DRAFT_237221 [Paraphysoderma sedebokerense]